MNERIRELAQQATETHTSYFDGRGNVTETVFDKEKFAELIVRECANRASWAQDTNEEDIGGEVLKHFGIKS
jgi:hypothetical protein